MYIVTGAGGHLGGTIVRKLREAGQAVRTLLLAGESLPCRPGQEVDACTRNPPLLPVVGDIRDKDSLRPLFRGTRDMCVKVVHAAGIVDISSAADHAIHDVNVGGTRNIVELCREYHVQRLLYVSSVHAIPIRDEFCVIEECRHFSPEDVTGMYAKTKAEATELVLDAVREGLDAVVVHPSGIVGPDDPAHNHLVQMVRDYVAGRLPAGVNGGFDFVDVRDVADGCLAALEKGSAGDCFILSNRHYSVKDILAMLRSICGGRKIPTLPIWIVSAVAPLLARYAHLRRRRPLYTRYSLQTLSSNDRYSHDKATMALRYHPRDLYRTLQDTVAWLRFGADRG